jgi:hypothetical protein
VLCYVDGWCRRRLNVGFGDCAYMTPSVLVLVDGAGLLYVGLVVGVCSRRRFSRGGGRVFEGVCAGDGAAYLVFIFIYIWFVGHIICLVGGRVGVEGVVLHWVGYVRGEYVL